MTKLNAYYQSIFNFDLSGLNVTEEDGVTVINFSDQLDVINFLHENKLNLSYLPNGMIVAVTKEAEPRVYGQWE